MILQTYRSYHYIRTRSNTKPEQEEHGADNSPMQFMKLRSHLCLLNKHASVFETSHHFLNSTTHKKISSGQMKSHKDSPVL